MISPILTARYGSQQYIQRGLVGGEGGRGLRTSNLFASGGVDKDTRFILMTGFTMVDAQ